MNKNVNKVLCNDDPLRSAFREEKLKNGVEFISRFNERQRHREGYPSPGDVEFHNCSLLLQCYSVHEITENGI